MFFLLSPQAGQPGTIHVLVDLLGISLEYSYLLDTVFM
jgi:hypothetical protein